MVNIINIETELDWMKYRNNGVGASEAAILFGLNNFKSKLEYFHDKLGFNFKPFYNLRMAYGTYSEALTSDLVACYNGDDKSHAMNLKNKLKFREVTKLPERAFVYNDLYENLFASPDRNIILDGVEGYVEAKDTSSQYLASFIDRISPAHIFQLKVQLMVGERSRGLLAYIIDSGREYKEHYFERDGVIFNDYKNNKVITEQDLKEEVEMFWQSVVLGRELSHKIMVAKQQYQYDKAAEYQALLDQVEPEPDFLLAYESYMKESYYTFAKPKIERQGTEADEQAAENFLKTKEQMKAAEEQHQKERNNILNLCKAGHKIILPGKGYIDVANTKVGISIKVKN